MTTANISSAKSTRKRTQTDSSSNSKPKLEDRFITNLKGKDFVLYAGLLDLAHQRGLFRLEVETIQFPNDDNGKEAICRAIAETHEGHIFSDIGDASPKNTNRIIVPHILRMASTRAKARALRDMTNIGMTCLEELGDMDEVLGQDSHRGDQYSSFSGNGNNGGSHGKNADHNGGAGPTGGNNGGNGPTKTSRRSSAGARTVQSSSRDTKKLTEAQRHAIYNLGQRKGITDEDLKEMSMMNFKASVENLSVANASSFIQMLQSS